MNSKDLRRLVILLAAVLVCAAPITIAQETDSKEKPAQESSEKKTEQEPEAKTAPAAKPITAIRGGEIHTITRGVIRGGTILIQDGKILEVGQDVAIPDGAQIIDATGKVVTPGFVAISMSGVALSGRGGSGRRGRGGGGDDEESDDNRLVDTLDPFDRNIKYALATGITTGCVQLAGGGGRRRRGRDGGPVEYFPGLEPAPVEVLQDEDGHLEDESTCGCCGLPVLPTEPITATPPEEAEARDHAVVKLTYGRLDPMLVEEDVFYDLAPGALNSAETRYQWREAVKGARQALQQQEQQQPERAARGGAQQRGQRGERGASRRGRGSRGRRGSRGPEIDPNLARLVKGEIALRTQANTVDEIRDQIALAEEFDYDLVLEGVIEGWLVDSELGEAPASVIFTPRQRRDPQLGQEDSSGSSIESTGIFERAGVPFATAALGDSVSMGGLAGRDLTSLVLEAAFAVRGGASEKTALESLTIVPARMLGMQDRIGSIEKGKDADILILGGDPLDYRTYVETAIVAGEVAYEYDVDGLYPEIDRSVEAVTSPR